MKNKIYSFLGLAKKAGRLFSGEGACEIAARSKKVFLIIVAENASDNTKKKFTNLCTHLGIEIRFFGEKEDLGKYTGKDIRAVIAIADSGFAKKLVEMVDGLDHQYGGGKFGEI